MTGHDVMFVPVSADDFVEGAVVAGVDRAEAKAFAELFSTVTDGRNAHLTGDVEALLGRPPSTFASYARATAATGVWDR